MSDFIKVIEENERPYISNVFVDYLKLPDPDLKILLILKSFAWNRKTDCYPRIETICKMAGKKRRQVSFILKNLQSRGLIRIEKKSGFANVYYITNKMMDDEALELSEPSNHAGRTGAGSGQTDGSELSTTHAVHCIPPMQSTAYPPCSPLHDIRKKKKSNKRRSSSASTKKQTEKSPSSLQLKKQPVPNDFCPNEKSRELLALCSKRTALSEEDLLKKFFKVMIEYKATSDDWQTKFGKFLADEKGKSTYEGKKAAATFASIESQSTSAKAQPKETGTVTPGFAASFLKTIRSRTSLENQT